MAGAVASGDGLAAAASLAEVGVRFVSGAGISRHQAVLDSGASANFVSPAVASLLPASSRAVTDFHVTLGDGSVVVCSESVSADFKVGSRRFSATFFVLPGCPFAAILGLPFVRANDYEVWRWIVVGDPAPTAPPAASPGGTLLTVATGSPLKRLLRKGGFLVAVDAVDEDTAPPAAPPAPKVHDSFRADFDPLITEFADVFSAPSGLPPLRPGFDHRIQLRQGAELPGSSRPFRLSVVEREELRRQLRSLLDLGWITQVHGARLACPAFFVAKRKPDGSMGFRLVVDWRGLNAITQPSLHPLPRIDDIIQSLCGSVVYSKLDLKTAFHQVRTDPADADYAVMSTPEGLFRWNVVSLGQTDAPSTMQGLMDHVLSGLPFTLCYLDDILVFSRRREDHVPHVRQVLGRLREHHLHLSAGKCELGFAEIGFLGVWLSPSGQSAHPDKLRAIDEWPTPRTGKDLRAFLGLCNYVRKHIERFAVVTAPLYARLPEGRAPLHWPPEADMELQVAKEALAAAVSLVIPDPAGQFRLEVDASGVGIGAALFQDGRPVGFASRSFSAAEAKMIVRDRELRAASFACRHWRHLLHGATFDLVTDHQPLRSIELSPTTPSHVTREVLFLEQFRYRWVVQPGAANSAADALSRHPVGGVVAVAASGVRVSADGDFQDDMLAAYRADAFFTMVLEVLEADDPPAQSHFVRTFSLRDRLLYYRTAPLDASLDRLCVPDDRRLKALLMHAVHGADSAAHPGFARTLAVARRHYFWRGMRRDIEAFVASCPVCQRAKPVQGNPTDLLVPLEPSLARWLSISIDFAVELPLSRGYRAVLLVVCRFTRRLRLLPVPDMTIDAPGAARLLLDHIVPVFGLPEDIVSDRDPRFTADLWRVLWRSLGVRLRMSTAAHPQSDGSTERAVRSMKDYLRSLCMGDPSGWADRLPLVEFAFNSHVNTSTGVTPFFADLGRHPRGPVDVVSGGPPSSSGASLSGMALQRQLSTISAELVDQGLVSRGRQAHFADRSRRPQDPVAPGDEVYVRSPRLLSPAARALPRPLRPRWAGPFVVHSLVGTSAARLSLPSRSRAHPVFNRSDLRPALPDQWPERGPPPPPTVDGEFEVEAILDHRRYPRGRSRRRSEFLVSWLGFPPDEASWEPVAHLVFDGVVCQALVDYCTAHGLPVPPGGASAVP